MKLSHGDIDINPLCVTRANERIMWLRISYTLEVIFLVSVYAPTGVGEFYVKKALYAQRQTVMDSDRKGDIFIVLGEHNATTSTEKDG